MFTVLPYLTVNMYGKVVLPTDGSKISYVGVKEGLKAAKMYDIPALAVYVIKPDTYSEGFIEDEMVDVLEES